MDLFTAIESRASAIKLTQPAPGRDHLERIINAGATAPDHGRLAPWRFAVMGPQARAQVGEVLAKIYQAGNPQAEEAQLQRERDKTGRAPAIIVVAARVNKEHKVPALEQLIAVGAAVENMFLAAHALGYGAMWKTGGASYNAEVNAVLGFEADDQIIGFLYLGTTEMAGKPRGPIHKEPVRWLD